MADRALNTAVGDALLGLLELGQPMLRPGVRRVLSRVAEAVRPGPPITLHTLDGHVLTGIAVMDRGQAIAFLGSRHPAPTASARSQSNYHDEPAWAREDDPYRR